MIIFYMHFFAPVRLFRKEFRRGAFLLPWPFVQRLARIWRFMKKSHFPSQTARGLWEQITETGLHQLGEHTPVAAMDILKAYETVFRTERRAKDWTPEARLELRKTFSEPAMRRIRELALSELLSENRLPAGRLTEPFAYILRHFERLVTFCSHARAPVHTNDVERALKKPILHRKNSLFFQTFAGSGVGDLFTSLFLSASLAGHNPIAFVREALQNWRTLARAPSTFTPWLVPQLK
jgi:hypothetical protein